MKKTTKFYTALFSASLALFGNSVWAEEAAEVLQQRLQDIESLSATFAQTVSDPDGKNIQQGEGSLQIKRPNLFRMDIKSPQETEIVADGETLWFYDPFIQQATASWMKDVVDNTPFILLTTNDKHYWQQYSVTQNGDTFTLKPLSTDSTLKQFDIRVDKNGLLRSFSTIERDGQTNLYILRNIHTQPLDKKLFKFTVSKDVELDDQRKK